MDIFILYMYMLYIKKYVYIYSSLGGRPLCFIEWKTGFTLQPYFTPSGLIIFLRRYVVCMTCFACCCRT